jgi:hypothetical protein
MDAHEGGFGGMVAEATGYKSQHGRRGRKGASASTRGSVMGGGDRDGDAETRFDIDSPWLHGKDVEKLRAIREQLSSSTRITTEIKTSLAEFDHKLTDLEKLVKPVQDETRLLKNAHTNIQRSLSSMESVVAHFRTAADASTTLRGEGLHGSAAQRSGATYNKYLLDVDRVKASLDYFRGGAASFKSAPEAARELEGLYSHAMEECLQEYTRILQAESSRPIDLREDALTGDTSGLVVFRHDALVHLQALCPRLQVSGSGAPEQLYARVRGGWIATTLAASVAGLMGSAELLTKAAQRYQRGSHPMIGYTDSCLRMLQAEQAVVEVVFGEAAAAERVFGRTCEPPMRQLAERAQELVELRQGEPGKEKPAAVADQLFVALDLFEQYSRQRGSFEGVLRGCDRASCDTCVGLFSEVQRGFSGCAERAFHSFFALLQNQAAWDRSPAEGATVHELTTTTLSFARRLLGYTHVLEGPELSPLLLAAVGGDGSSASVPGVLRAALKTSAHHMLQHATRGYRSSGGGGSGGKEELSALFALNNLVYIARSLRAEPQLSRLVGEDFLSGLKQHRRGLVKEFTSARWGVVAQVLRGGERDDGGVEPLLGKNQAAMKKELKSRFKTINGLFTRGEASTRFSQNLCVCAFGGLRCRALWPYAC